jgi:DNA-binding protein YbaB
MRTAQQRIDAMERELTALKYGARSVYSTVSVHVMATSRGWNVYIDSERLADGIDALDIALDIAEAHTQRLVQADDRLARTLGVAS